MSSAELPIEHMCALAGVSRRGFYRFDPEAQPAERDMLEAVTTTSSNPGEVEIPPSSAQPPTVNMCGQ